MLTGTLDPARLTTFPFPAPLALDDTFVVQVAWEIAGTGGMLLPPALHPTAPTLVSVLAVEGHAQVRLSCRHGARARALVIATSSDVDFDGERLRVGDALTVTLTPPTRALGPHDVQYVTSLWPVITADRGLRLVQQEVDVEVPAHTRWGARCDTWPASCPAPAHVVAASVAHGSVHLPAPRFMARPDVPAFEGSEHV